MKEDVAGRSASGGDPAAESPNDAGDLDIAATRSLTIEGSNAATPAGIFARTGAVIGTGTEAGSADGGSITVTSPEITLMGSAVISARSVGEGNPGQVAIRARAPAPDGTVDTAGSTLRLIGTADGAAEISTRARSGDTGGAIDVAMGEVVIEDGGAIAASTSGTSPGGLITLTADTLTVRGERPGVSPDTAAILSDSSSESSDGGAAGAIVVELAGDLFVGEGGEIRARTRGGGDAGSITIDAEGIVAVEHGGRINAAALGTATGEAGDVSIAARTVSLEGGEISTEAANGTADGVVDPIGGNLTITARDEVRLARGAAISASSLGTQDAGRIAIDAGQTLRALDSRITTEATVGDAAGGQIDLRALDLIELFRSTVSTSVRGFDGDEAGGDVTVDPPRFMVVNQSEILAQAIRGDGGNIRITAGTFLESADSMIDASSQLGVDGTVVVESPEDPLKVELLQLPSEFLDATRLLGERCAARDGASGSFVISSRSGRAASPRRALPAQMPLPADLDLEADTLDEASFGARAEAVMLSSCGRGRATDALREIP